jgi:extracellular solute-binding protein (family 5)
MADWEAPGTFDPRPPTTAARLRADTLVFGRLWIPDPGGRLIPDLAAAVPRPAGGLLTVRLRPGLRWSDGTPLTAGDVASSCARQGFRAEAVTATSLRVTASDAAELATVFITPADPDGRVASGPFRLTGAAAGELRFERNPYYHRHPAYLAAIVELLPASHDAMVELGQVGEADYLPHLGPEDLGTRFGTLRTVVTRSQRQEVLVPEGVGAATAAALSAATDRQALADQLFSGTAAALGMPRQLDLARFLLRGRPAAVPLQTVCDDPLRASEAALLATQWAGAGVHATVSCAPIAGLTATSNSTRVALYSVLLGQAPAGAISLLRWPGIRAVSANLHGFAADDTAGTDLWNVADWWLS